jgi:hypothetical protein
VQDEPLIEPKLRPLELAAIPAGSEKACVVDPTGWCFWREGDLNSALEFYLAGMLDRAVGVDREISFPIQRDPVRPDQLRSGISV